MKRSKFGLSHYKLLSCDMGKLVPLTCFEVLPGDSVQQATSCLIRLSPLLAPVMHPVQVRIHHWFVPHRLVWNQWEDFITGGSDGLGDGAVYPTILADGTAKRLPEYLGVPRVARNVSALPIRSYNKIYNEFYRDQDLVPEVEQDALDVQNIAWQKDYFTSARPWPQKGPDVSLPLGTKAPITGLGLEALTWATGPVTFAETKANKAYAEYQYFNVTAGARQAIEKDPVTGRPGIYADLTNATAVNVNDVRKAFAMQRYEEARAQYGSRYTEYLRYLGVRSSDARLQRPEYLGGGKATVSFSEVLQTAPDIDTGSSESTGVGALKGHGIAALRSRRYRRFFEEHGCVLTLLSVRPKTMYVDGLDKMWNRRTKEDYWQRELELIGQQQILKGEVYSANDGTEMNVWGYQNRYDEYRHIESGIAGDFRDTLDFWHMARKFGAAPALNRSFVECDPTKRIHAVQSEDVLWIMANHSVQARRMLTKRTIGRIV